WRGLQRVFGRAPGLFPNEYQPSWVIEGLATYYESKFTNAGRVRGSFHTQVLGADRAAGASRSPWNATLFTRWADGLVPYAYGSRFFHYLAGAVGDSVVPRFVEATSAQLIPFRVGRQVARVASGRTLGRDWPRGTAPDLPGTSVAPPAGRVLDSLLRTEPVPRVSPDGRRVAYVRDDGKGASVLRVLDVATERSLAAHRVNGGVDYDWLGDTLVITQLDFTTRWRIRSDLYRWVPGGAAPPGVGQVYRWGESGGGRAQPLTNEPLGARAPAPLPDGTLLYAALRARGWELRRTSALEQAAPVTFAEPLAFDSAPAVPLSETGYTMWPSLRPQFWIPVFENAGPTGRFGGALTAGTDALGRFAYATDLFVSPEPFR